MGGYVEIKRIGGADVAAPIGENADGQAVRTAGVEAVLARLQLFDGTSSWNRAASANSLDGGLAYALVVHDAFIDDLAGVFSTLQAKSNFRYRTVGTANTALAVVVDLRNLHDTLAIHAVASAGTFTLLVEVSADNTNFLTLDSVVAAATQVKQYVAATVGAAIALSPLAFRYVRITAGAAGAANTVTMTIGAK